MYKSHLKKNANGYKDPEAFFFVWILFSRTPQRSCLVAQDAEHLPFCGLRSESHKYCAMKNKITS